MTQDKTMQDVMFIYEHKNTGEIRAKWLVDAVAMAIEANESWNHIGTIEPTEYISTLLNEYPALVRKMKGDTA